MELTGSQIVIECLKEQGVDTVFGYPGGTILNIYDELYRHPEIHHILTSHAHTRLPHGQTGMRVRPEKQAYVWQQAALVRQILSLELQLPTWILPRW